ncbi:MAG: ABC transporter permease, partial [Ruthenibacterium sp.]
YVTMENVSNILNQAMFLAVVGLAQFIVILTTGINLAIGSVMVLTAITAGSLLSEASTVSFIVPVLIMLVFSLMVGFGMGGLVAKVGLPSFIVTFAVMYIFRGTAWLIMGKNVLYRVNSTIAFWSTGRLFTICGFTVTMPMLIVTVLLCIFHFVLKKTSFGRQLYFTGTNPVASEFSGVRSKKILVLAYGMSGLLCGIAVILYTGRLNAVEPAMYSTIHFEAIAVALVGGASFAGGIGDVKNTLLGAIIIQFIKGGMNSLRIASEWQNLVLGALIIISVIINQSLQNKRDVLEDEIRQDNNTKGGRKNEQKQLA